MRCGLKSAQLKELTTEEMDWDKGVVVDKDDRAPHDTAGRAKWQ